MWLADLYKTIRCLLFNVHTASMAGDWHARVNIHPPLPHTPANAHMDAYIRNSTKQTQSHLGAILASCSNSQNFTHLEARTRMDKMCQFTKISHSKAGAGSARILVQKARYAVNSQCFHENIDGHASADNNCYCKWRTHLSGVLWFSTLAHVRCHDRFSSVFALIFRKNNITMCSRHICIATFLHRQKVMTQMSIKIIKMVIWLRHYFVAKHEKKSKRTPQLARALILSVCFSLYVQEYASLKQIEQYAHEIGKNSLR